jgi:hypothetical protein
MLPLSTAIRSRLKLSRGQEPYLQINCIEFLTALLEYACAVTVFCGRTYGPNAQHTFSQWRPSHASDSLTA